MRHKYTNNNLRQILGILFLSGLVFVSLRVKAAEALPADLSLSLNTDSVSPTLPAVVSPYAAMSDSIVAPTLSFGSKIGSLSIPDSIGVSPSLWHHITITPYALPYSLTGRSPDWHRLWLNSAVLGGAFVGTLLVLECLPEDATSWNRAEIRYTPLFRRWYNHVFVKGPEWDHDKFIFNYVLHPYAGAVYYMAARSNGFNCWQSFLYCAIVSNIGWEFGIEAFMERPSYQDMIVTPIVGSLIGEGFYAIKRQIVNRNYELLGSPVLGNIVAFLVDPVNEFVGLFDKNPARIYARNKHDLEQMHSMRRPGTTFTLTPSVTTCAGAQGLGFSFLAVF